MLSRACYQASKVSLRVNLRQVVRQQTCKTLHSHPATAQARPLLRLGQHHLRNERTKRFYGDSSVAVPPKSIEGFGGPTDKMHYSDQVELACRDGIALKERGDVDAALEKYTKAIELSGETSYRAYSLRADLNQLQGRLPEALSDYERVLSFIPTHVPTLVSQASCYKRMGDYERALKHFDFILTFEGMYSPAWIGKGECHARLGQHEEAVRSYRKALEYKDRWIPTGSVYEALGDSLLMTNQVEAAINAYKDSLGLTPESGSCWGALGVALYIAKQYPQATEAFTESLRLGNHAEPRHAVLTKRASCYLQFENLEKSMADIEEALKDAPKFYKAVLIRGQCRQAEGDLEGAIEDYDLYLNEVENTITEAMKASTVSMGEHWQQLASIRVRRAECQLNLWLHDLETSGVSIPSFDEDSDNLQMPQKELVALFEQLNLSIPLLGDKGARAKAAFDDLVAARRLNMTEPNIPWLLSIINTTLEHRSSNKSRRN